MNAEAMNIVGVEPEEIGQNAHLEVRNKVVNGTGNGPKRPLLIWLCASESLKIDGTFVLREGRGLRSVPNIDLRVQVGDMTLHGASTEHQLCGDLAGGFPFCDQHKDIHLPLG